MSSQDFSDLTPPHNQVLQWIETAPSGVYLIQHIADQSSLWGAEQAAERLKGQWPEPITDRLPTEADGNSRGWVQYVRDDGAWDFRRWDDVAADGDDWQHCPNWQPPAPPTLKELALKALDGLGTQPASTFRQLDPSTEELIRRALEADS